MPGNEQVGDDHVEALVGGGQEAPTVADDQTHVAPLEQPAVPGAEMRPRRVGDFRHQLDHRGLVEVQRRPAAGADAGRQPDEQRAMRVRMQQQRHQPEAPFVADRGAPAQHVEVVEAQLQIVRHFDHGDRAAGAFGRAAQRLTRPQIDERCAERVCDHHKQHRRVAERPPAPQVRGSDVGEDDVGQCNDQQRSAHAEVRDADERGRQCAGHGAERVGRRQTAERSRRAHILAPRSPQRRQDDAGCERCRSGAGGYEADDAQQVFAQAAAHANVRQPIGQVDEQPQPADGRHRRQRAVPRRPVPLAQRGAAPAAPSAAPAASANT